MRCQRPLRRLVSPAHWIEGTGGIGGGPCPHLVVGGHVLVRYIGIKRICKADCVVCHDKVAGVEPAGSSLRFRGDFWCDIQAVAHLHDRAAADAVDFDRTDE